MPRYGRGLIFILLALAFAFIIKAAFYQGWLRLNYPSRQQWLVQGIDISHHQKNIDRATSTYFRAARRSLMPCGILKAPRPSPAIANRFAPVR